jgi:chromosome segregation ATPase
MIDKQYIESAKNIKSEFISLNKKLDIYKKDLENLSEYLQTTIADLNNMTNKKVDSKHELQSIAENLIKKIEEIEIEEKKMTNLVKPINDRIDKLKEEETILYNALKTKYPNLNDEEMRKEIHSRI